MAITSFSYAILRSAFENGLLPKAQSILEFGEANWYGDVPVEALHQDIKNFVKSDEERNNLERQLGEYLTMDAGHLSFGLAKIFYGIFFGNNNSIAIDFHGTENCLKLDLNAPLEMTEQFDVTINNGTAEHIFNSGQFFTTMHQTTKPGGLMMHEGPMIKGWVDHGFVNFQPTLFYDLAAANGYKVELFCMGGIDPLVAHLFESREDILKFVEQKELPDNTVFLVLLRKAATETDFVFPIQGYYADSISEDARTAWKNLR